ncbi:MAG: hypothetical protein UHI81_08355 [Olegusella sp.]|nr:hypothetical protein [Olegusella sp.]
MVNVNESDMSFMNVLLHGKGHGGLRKAALASIAAVFAAVAITVMRAGDTDLSMSLLIGLVIAGCYALWLGFLAYSVYDLRALLTMGARGKAAVVIGLAAPLVLLLWLWGSSARMVAIFYGMGEPFAFPVLVNAVMLVTGFFSGSPYDGDEELARRIQDLSPADLTGLPLEEVPFSPEDLFTLMGGFDLGYVACSTRNLNGKAIMRKQAYKDEWRRDLVKRYHAAGWVDAEGNPNEELGRWVRLISSPGVVIMNDKFGRGTAEVIFNDDAACAVVRAPGHGESYLIKPFPADKSRWGDEFNKVFPAADYPLAQATLDLHTAIAPCADEPRSLPLILGDRDYAAIHTYAQRHGVPEDVLLDLADRRGGYYRLYIDDTRGATFDTSNGFTNPLGCTGPGKVQRAWVFPKVGGAISGCNAWHPGVREDWSSHVDEQEMKDQTLFYALDFSSRGSLWEICTRLGEYPFRDVVDLSPTSTLLG